MILELRVCALYPDVMNIYADRGNLLMLARRCAWRGIDFRLSSAGLGQTLSGAGHHLYYLGVCGGYQLLGRSYQLGDEVIDGVGLLDVHTIRADGARLIGNVAIELPDGRVLAGFENHGGRTHLAPGQAPLGRVLRGRGNDGRSGQEGARRANVIGTYLHGPLLPKNSWFCDWLIATALGIDALAPLDDGLEAAAHQSALRAAGV